MDVDVRKARKFSKKQIKELSSSSRRYIVESAEPKKVTAQCKPGHPQLRELITCPSSLDRLALVSHKGVFGIDFSSSAQLGAFSALPRRATRLFDLSFGATCITSGHGLLAFGGQCTELSIRSLDGKLASAPSTSKAPSWATANYAVGSSINNSIHIARKPGLAVCPSREGKARLYVSNNDYTLSIWDVDPPLASTSSMLWQDSGGMQLDEEGYENDRERSEIILQRRKILPMSTAINHSSVSPDGAFLVAVGDTNEVFFYSVPRFPGEDYRLLHTTTASRDASFSTDWSRDSLTCAVASQDGVVTIFDVRSISAKSDHSAKAVAAFHTTALAETTLPSSSATRRHRSLLPTHTAARSVKFSPGTTSELLAFSEQSDHVHVADARTFDPATVQTLSIPSSLPSISTGDVAARSRRLAEYASTNRDAWFSPNIFSRLATAQSGLNRLAPPVGDRNISRSSSASSTASAVTDAQRTAEYRPATLPSTGRNHALMLAESAVGATPPAFQTLADYFAPHRAPMLASLDAESDPLSDDWGFGTTNTPSAFATAAPVDARDDARLPALESRRSSRSYHVFESPYELSIGNNRSVNLLDGLPRPPPIAMDANEADTVRNWADVTRRAARIDAGIVELCGICWSPSGNKLFVATELSTYEYEVDTLSRVSFPSATII